jgi:ectoine hydroxylase-related dioxygenase (phytanoyl-CoA dioxygenase family)
LKDRRSALGYSIHHHVFERTEMARTLEMLASADIERTKAGARHVLGVPIVHELAKDRRLMAIAARFAGNAPIPFRATLFDKSPGANWLVAWHQDTALPLCRRIEDGEWGPWSTKGGVLYAHAPAWALERVVALRVSLDDSMATNGPLRVLPETHRNGVLAEERIEQVARDLTPVECVTLSGGVVVMRPLTVHASSKSTDDRPRRVLHIEYAAARQLGSGVELAIG